MELTAGHVDTLSNRTGDVDKFNGTCANFPTETPLPRYRANPPRIAQKRSLYVGYSYVERRISVPLFLLRSDDNTERVVESSVKASDEGLTSQTSNSMLNRLPLMAAVLMLMSGIPTGMKP